MASLSISKSILSISTPGTNLTPTDSTAAIRLTRSCNSYAASLKLAYPDKFGFWASLPLPLIEPSLKEIGTALSEGADGFCLLSNHHGIYPGDPKLDPIFEELNRRRATVFIHPTTPCLVCPSFAPSFVSSAAMPAGSPERTTENGDVLVDATPLSARFPPPVFEFFFDTARVVISLFISGTIARCPNVTFLIPHAGGCLPPLLSRFTGFAELVPGQPGLVVTEETVREALQKQFYFDLAGWTFPGQLPGMLKSLGMSTSRLLYGSDFPFTNADGVKMFAGKLDEGVKEIFTEDEIEDVYHKNARRLLRMELPLPIRSESRISRRWSKRSLASS